MRRFLRNTFIFLLLFGFIATVGAWQYYQQFLDRPLNLPQESIVFVVPPHSNLTRISEEFGLSDYLQADRLLLLHARLNDTQSVQAGEYLITQQDTPRTLNYKLHTGDVIDHEVSLIEGTRISEMIHKLARDGRLIDDVSTLSDSELVARIAGADALSVSTLEGLIYPDTYRFERGETASNILRRAFARSQQILQEEWQQRDPSTPYQSPYEALIMASIIERETGVASEREEIAGVFVRRLQQGMRLQTDPTVIYGLGDRYQGNLTRAHLREYTPYNTYVISGLPPSPIAAPGRAAIHAALNPQEGRSLYFVARGDGSHVFSDSLDAHNEAVRRYQIEQRALDYRSSPSEARE